MTLRYAKKRPIERNDLPDFDARSQVHDGNFEDLPQGVGDKAGRSPNLIKRACYAPPLRGCLSELPVPHRNSVYTRTWIQSGPGVQGFVIRGRLDMNQGCVEDFKTKVFRSVQ